MSVKDMVYLIFLKQSHLFSLNKIHLSIWAIKDPRFYINLIFKRKTNNNFELNPTISDI